MKARLLLPLVAASLFAATEIQAIQLGDSRADVVAEMGQPSGEIGSGDLVVLFFQLGEVHLRDGQVSAIDLITPEEHAKRKAAEAAELERIREAEAARRARVEAEGLALFAKKKADYTFLQQPAAEQLRFWRWFGSQYPMVPIEEELRTALAKYEQQQRLLEIEYATNQRIEELEKRVEDAEREAERAERRRYYGYPYSYGRYPIIVNPRPHPRYRGKDYDRDYVRQQGTGINTSTDLRSQAMSNIEANRTRAYQSVSGPQATASND
jgi:hypothetical protein